MSKFNFLNKTKIRIPYSNYIIAALFAIIFSCSKNNGDGGSRNYVRSMSSGSTGSPTPNDISTTKGQEEVDAVEEEKEDKDISSGDTQGDENKDVDKNQDEDKDKDENEAEEDLNKGNDEGTGDSTMNEECCEFKINECPKKCKPWGLRNHWRKVEIEFPENYEFCRTKLGSVECVDDGIRNQRSTSNNFRKVEYKTRQIAYHLGISPTMSSDAQCMNEKLHITYFPSWRGWSCFGIRGQAKKCFKKNCVDKCDSCPWLKDLNFHWRKDRIALISFQKDGFWQQLPLLGQIDKYAKWKYAKKQIIEKINDVESGSDEYPKVKLEMVQYITYTYDKAGDSEKAKYYTCKGGSELLDFMRDAKPHVTKDGKKLPYVCEKVLRKFKFGCVVTNGCEKKCFKKYLRGRDSLVFIAQDECGENGQLPFKEIHGLCSLRSKAIGPRVGPKAKFLQWRPWWSAIRVIKMKVLDEDCCRKDETLGYTSQVWRFTIFYKDKEGNIKSIQKENEVEWKFN